MLTTDCANEEEEEENNRLDCLDESDLTPE